MAGSSAREPIVVTHEGGVRFAAKVGSHVVTVDQPLRGGGQDTAPAPIELLGTALGTCIALYVQQFCHSRHLPYEGMRVEVEQYGAANPSRIGQFNVKVVLPVELPPHEAAMLERVARSCPAHGTLVHGAQVDVAIRALAPAASGAGGMPS